MCQYNYTWWKSDLAAISWPLQTCKIYNACTTLSKDERWWKSPWRSFFLTTVDNCRLARHTCTALSSRWKLFPDHSRRCKKAAEDRRCSAYNASSHPQRSWCTTIQKQWPATKHWLQGQIMKGHVFDQDSGWGGRMMKKIGGTDRLRLLLQMCLASELLLISNKSFHVGMLQNRSR